MKRIPQICLGCGAPLHGPVCEFCGREYDLDEKYKIEGDLFYDKTFEVTFMGKKLKMYASDIHIEPIYREAARTLDGRLSVSLSRPDPIITLRLTSI